MSIRTAGRLLLVQICILAVAGCATTRTQRPEELVTPLPKLTSAVQALVLYPDPDKSTPDDRLVSEAIKDSPELQSAFQGLPIQVVHDTRDVILLICSPDGSCAWLEDASWTPVKVDYKWYQSKPPKPAKFTMQLRGH